MSDQAPEIASTPTVASAGAAETAQQDPQPQVDWETKLKQTSSQSFAAGRREAQEQLEAAEARIRELEEGSRAKQEAEASAEQLRAKLAEERKQREALEQFRAERLERDKARIKARTDGLPERLQASVARALERDDTDTAEDLIEAYRESLPQEKSKPLPRRRPQGSPPRTDGPVLSIGAIVDGIKRGDTSLFNRALKAGMSKGELYKAMRIARR